MKRTAFLACALVTACAFAHAESPAASAGPDVNVVPAISMPALDVALIAPLKLADATMFVAGMSGGYTLSLVDIASHFASSSCAHAANDARAGFDLNALYSPPLYEAAPPWSKTIGRHARHSRQIDRWRT